MLVATAVMEVHGRCPPKSISATWRFMVGALQKQVEPASIVLHHFPGTAIQLTMKMVLHLWLKEEPCHSDDCYSHAVHYLALAIQVCH